MKRAISLLLSAAFALSTIAVASAATCATTTSASNSGMAMACCVKHDTAGINAPCHCSIKSVPASAPQTATSTNLLDLDAQYAEAPQPKPFVGFTQEPINSQWLALDCRLRAPPPRIYLVNCSFLE